ncbi:hypothetical protein [Halomonas sp. 707B3]|uniref:hypothetical protein n=1 Tax=Halomonas sp. 707B3 TaxID=1681043 RepID=UPI00209CEF31|nr:hypothetical protein [Halomonas sp. 707B3]MCP1316891.1 hypothetical protein [Halomonas sp. 707B3]
MNEHSFIRSVHRQLPASIYRWKINDNFQGGVADAYYSDKGGDLWIEYKYLKALPKRPTTEIKTTLSAQQACWLTERHNEGRTVAVVIGSPSGIVLLTSPDEWNTPLTCADFIRTAIDKQRLVSYIVETTTSTT